MARYRTWIFAGLIILVGVVAIAYQYHITSENTASVADEIVEADEDFFGDNIHILKYKADGSIYYEMQSTHITHNDTHDIAWVTEPVMTLHATQNVSWNARAQKGKVYNHQQNIDLTDHVSINKQENGQATPVLTLTTNSLTLHPEDNTFTTSDHVTLTTDKISTTATGMKANMNTNYIELLNNVRTHYGK